MRHFSGSKQENDKGDRMSRARSARDGFAIAGPQWQDLRSSIGRHLPNTKLLPSLVPILLSAFFAVALIGFAIQVVHAKRVALDSARTQHPLIARLASLSRQESDHLS